KCSDKSVVEEPSVPKEGTFSILNPCTGLTESQCRTKEDEGICERTYTGGGGCQQYSGCVRVAGQGQSICRFEGEEQSILFHFVKPDGSTFDGSLSLDVDPPNFFTGRDLNRQLIDLDTNNPYCTLHTFEYDGNTYAFYILGDKCGYKTAMLEKEGLSISPANNFPSKEIVEDTCTLLQNSEESEPGPEPEEECGNGRIDAGESCDGNNLGGKTCQTVDSKFTGGDLKCNVECKFDTRECICRKVTPFGNIEIEGGIYNKWFDHRLAGYGNLEVNFIQTGPTEKIIEENMTIKLWIHKDLYDVEYDTFTKYNPPRANAPEWYIPDLFRLKNHFPPESWREERSFVIILRTTIREVDGRKYITLESKYKQAGDTRPQQDMKTLTLSGSIDGRRSDSAEISYEDNVKQVIKSIVKLHELYIIYSDDDLAGPMIGVGPFSGGPAYIRDSLVSDWVQKSYLDDFDDSELGEDKRYNLEAQPKIRRSINEKIQRAVQNYDCD
ncbi:MAG: hypothetical protein ABIB47_00460, partial [Candidatus Woesearchaeota archaeon]